jgi:poly(A) polymerase
VSPSKWIRIKKPLPLPAYVREALQRLDEAGHVAYVVGGSVRDFLLERETKDHDIATSAKPDELMELFPNAITVGKAFGVLKIPVDGAPVLEIATFREDLDYRDHRRPRGVLFAGPLEDAQRRDFTVNGIYYDHKTGRVLDSVGGMDDLKNRIIRAIGVPAERFKEDALRLLRAVRFATTLGFEIDPATADAVRARAQFVTHVSGERVRDELELVLTGPRPDEAFKLLMTLGLLRHLLPELDRLKGVEQSPLYHPEGDVWKHTLKAMACLARQNPVRRATLAWGTLLHDVGKPVAARRSGGRNFKHHETDGSHIAAAVCERMKLARADTERVVALIEDHLKFKDVFQMREATLQRLIREPHFEELLALHKADATASDGNLAYYEFCSARLEARRKAPSPEAPRLIDGEDLIQLGLSPGPEFSRILRVVEDLAYEKKLKSKEQALEYVVLHFVK